MGRFPLDLHNLKERFVGGIQLRVAILTYGLARGGRSRMVTQLANGLARRGHQVQVVLLEGQPIFYPLHVPVHRVPQLTADLLPEADLLMATSWGLIAPARASGKGKTVRFCTEYEPDQVYDTATVTALYRQPIPTLAVSEPLAEQIAQMSGSPCRVAQPGVDGKVFRPVGRRAPGGPRRIGYVYRHEALGYGYKASPDFWQVMQRVMAVAEVEIAVLAPDGLDLVAPIPFAQVRAETDQQLADFYRSVEILVSASLSEGYSLTTLEAMACGTVTVLTDGGGIRDYAHPGQNCFMGVAGDVEMLTSLVMAALHHPEMAATFVKGGLATASQRTWERFAEQADVGLRALLTTSEAT